MMQKAISLENKNSITGRLRYVVVLQSSMVRGYKLATKLQKCTV